jgi:hypothetical protein
LTLQDDGVNKIPVKVIGKISGLEIAGSVRNISRSRSRENLAVGAPLSMLPQGEGAMMAEKQVPNEVIFTTARPATVISNCSTASSPAPSEMKLTKEERYVILFVAHQIHFSFNV